MEALESPLFANSAAHDLARQLIEVGQGHIFKGLADASPADRQAFVEQLLSLDQHTPGGLISYVTRAKKLLQDSLEGKNPLEGWSPSIPDGIMFDYGTKEFRTYEDAGVDEAIHCAFVLVAGGLGERLGYSHIKVSLPSNAFRDVSFLQYYIESILALQASGGPACSIPLAIMTSDDTHGPTARMLEENAYFGMKPEQVTLIKQEKVPCLMDNEAHLALEDSKLRIMTKPHGHGDVHSLLHTSGLVEKWAAEGRKWVCFFQDTNVLVFRGLLAAIGVSQARDYDMNSQTVPRAAKEAIGAICRLTRGDASLTINVEYNQLDPMLRGGEAFPNGDVNDPQTQLSPFPGNINQIVVKLETYRETLRRTGGVVAEFVNPKYKDASRREFKAPTRLECMMQDLPHSLPPTAKVGFTQTNETWAAYSPVKNSPQEALRKVREGCPSHSATAADFDLLRCHCAALRAVQPLVMLGGPTRHTFNGLGVDVYPQVVWSPSFALSLSQLQARLDGPLRLSSRSTLLLEGDVCLRSLDLDGALVVKALNGSRIVIENLTVRNDGWILLPCGADEPVREEDVLRGFKVAVEDQEEVAFDDGQTHTITGVRMRQPKTLSGSPIATEIIETMTTSFRTSVLLTERMMRERGLTTSDISPQGAYGNAFFGGAAASTARTGAAGGAHPVGLPTTGQEGDKVVSKTIDIAGPGRVSAGPAARFLP